MALTLVAADWGAILAPSFGRVHAQPAPPPAPRAPFTDAAGVISRDDASRLNARLREIESEAGNQIVAVVYPALPDGWAGIEEFANRRAQTWRVGEERRDNGVVILVFIKERQVRIEVGYGLEGALPDVLAARIIRDEVVPEFRAGRYAAGIAAAIDAIDQATRGEYAARDGGAPRSGDDPFELLVVILVVVVLILWALPRGHYRTYSRHGSWRGDVYRGGFGGGGYSGGGFGGGGGGWSGGGGSFGGGGASGSW